MATTDLKVHLARYDIAKFAYCGAGKKRSPRAVISTKFEEVTCGRCLRIVERRPWLKDRPASGAYGSWPR